MSFFSLSSSLVGSSVEIVSFVAEESLLSDAVSLAAVSDLSDSVFSVFSVEAESVDFVVSSFVALSSADFSVFDASSSDLVESSLESSDSFFFFAAFFQRKLL